MPAEVVFALNSRPFVESFATTSAFGTAAPLGSVINPVIAPRSPCANRTPSAVKVNTTLKKIFIPTVPPNLHRNIMYRDPLYRDPPGNLLNFALPRVDDSRGTHGEFTVRVPALSACYAIDTTGGWACER